MLKEKRLLKNQGGQALIIILLAMSVVMTVVLSSASRSITEVATTSYEEDALRAFSAAEAGVEEKLLDLGTVGAPPETLPVDSSDPSSATYTIETKEQNFITGNPHKLFYPENLSVGETATLWLVSKNEDGQLSCNSSPCLDGTDFDVCYGSNNSDEPAIEVSVYYDKTKKSIDSTNNYQDVEVYREVFDRYNNIPEADDDNYSIGVCNNVALRRAPIVMSNFGCDGDLGCALFIEVRMLHGNDQQVGFWLPGNTANIPAQGVLISSEGSAGDSTRKVEVYQGLPKAPDPFDVAVYAKNGLNK